MQPAVHIEIQVDGLDHILAGTFPAPPTVGGDTDHQVSGRHACIFGGLHGRFNGVNHRDAAGFAVSTSPASRPE